MIDFLATKAVRHEGLRYRLMTEKSREKAQKCAKTRKKVHKLATKTPRHGVMI